MGDAAVVEVTGLRNPCAQLDRIHPGLSVHDWQSKQRQRPRRGAATR